MAKKKTELDTSSLRQEEFIQVSNIEDVMSEGFGRYSKYVLQERAVPDVRDGLKPVQRRILYTMILEGNVSSKPTRKCARTVGAVIGRFHPHGDTSVYEAMVRMSQDWKMRYPLIDFQGNNGSIDGDGPAAYRYTEARLSELSDLMVQDLNKNTVDMQLNFDDLEFEPTVLPARFPNLLVNGTQGIAIGSSTDIPPHNLREVIDAINYRISHKKCSTKELMEFIKGPDFPTGGIIKDTSILLPMYESGNGSFKLWCKTEVNTSLKDINQIIITEIPWGKDKSELVNNIDKCRFANKLDAIIEVRDETDRDGLRIAIDIKKDSDPNNILNFLLSKGVLCSTIKFNCLVIDHDRPVVAPLTEMIDCYIEHQVDVLTRRSKFDLEKAENRLHIVEGLIKACSIIDEVVSLIKKSKDKADAKVNLVKQFSFSEVQAEAILNLQLYRLSNLDIMTLVNEKDELTKTIEYLKGLLESPAKMNNLIKSDLNKVKEKFGDDRRTLIEDQDTSFDIDKKALISKDECMISFTRDGYIKRSNLKSFKSSEFLPNIKLGDCIKGIVKAYTTDSLLLFTNFGNYICLPVYKLDDMKWKEEGSHINDISTLSPKEKIIKGIIVREFIKGVSITLISKLGQIKRSPLYQFETSKFNKPSKCFKLLNDDEVMDVKTCFGQTGLGVVLDNGSFNYFDESEVKKVGVKAGGIKGIKMDKDSKYLSQLISLEPHEKVYLHVITKQSGVRLIDSSHLEKTSRLSAKENLIKSFKSDPQNIIYINKVGKKTEDSVEYVLYENQEVKKIEFKDIKLTPLDSYLKSDNLELGSAFNIVDYFNIDVEIISADSKLYEPLVEEDETSLIDESDLRKIEIPTAPIVSEESNDEKDKISLFDFVDDD